MIVDGRSLPGDAVVRADVAVVGAGPAGIVTALELADGGFHVVLLESGHTKPDAAVQRLGDADEWDPGRHAPMSMTTRRQLGGASVIWGGRCVPFDPVDFDRREVIADHRWPLGYDDLQPFFQRACDWFHCGRAVFDVDRIPSLARARLVPGFEDDEVRASTLERWSLPTNFGREYGQRIRRSQRVRLITGLTCTEVVCDESGSEVSSLEARSLGGKRVRIEARRYVLACGGLETTRLLLASRRRHASGLGNHSGHLGRWYMAHLEGAVARVRFSTPPEETIYGYERDIDGVYVRRRISFSREFIHDRGLPNIVGWIANPELPDPAHGNGVLSFAYVALASPLGRFFAPDAQRQSLTGAVVPGAPYGGARRGSFRDHRTNMLRDLGPTARFAIGFGYRRFLPRRRLPGFFVYSAENAYPLHYHGEHLPNADSRITVTDRRDAVGMPRLRIDLRFSQADVDGVVRAHRLWDEYLRKLGLGRLEYFTSDVESSIWERIGGGFHQMGTTRMSARPEDGVVDPDLAVHGIDNLSVVSSSVFVTSGQANSTFMIVVFALRLADRLKSRLRTHEPARVLAGGEPR